MNREEARMELIRTKRAIYMYDLPSEAFEAIDMAIEALSEPSIVRCGECKHRYYADNRVPHERNWVCERFADEEVTDADFCSYGERREP